MNGGRPAIHPHSPAPWIYFCLLGCQGVSSFRRYQRQKITNILVFVILALILVFAVAFALTYSAGPV